MQTVRIRDPEWKKVGSATLNFCSMLFTVPSTGGFERKPYFSLVSKVLTKKIHLTRKLESIYEVLELKDEGRKPDKNSSLRRLEFLPRNIEFFLLGVLCLDFYIFCTIN
jgi:hypothetical protein